MSDETKEKPEVAVKKPLSFKDFLMVDYTFSWDTDPSYDPDGLLAHQAWQRQLGEDVEQ